MTAGGSAMAAEMEAMRREGCAPPGLPGAAPVYPMDEASAARGTYAAGAARAEGWEIVWLGGTRFAVRRFLPECQGFAYRAPFRTDAEALEHVRQRADDGSKWHADALRIAGPSNQPAEGEG